MGKLLLLALALVLVSTEIVSAATKNVVCYYGSWAHYRNGNGKFTVDKIDPNLCTHVTYTFVGLNDDGSVRIMDTWLEEGLKNLENFVALKKINPNLKTLIAIGGWNEGSLIFSKVAASAEKRARLIQSALELVQQYGFDGFDLDWEYPGQRGGAAADKENFSTLLREFREVWDKHGLLLTAAVAAPGAAVDLSYDVPVLSKYLDIINVMAYDIHGPWESVTGQNAPLYPGENDVTQTQRDLTVDASIRAWIQRGADPQKIALGLGVYGHTFTLASAANNKLGAPAVNGGLAGKYTQQSGMLGYNEICETFLEGGWEIVWDHAQKVPYATKGNQWIGYDDTKSIAIKVNYAKSHNLGGVMIWSIETEDFNGVCGPKYPILNAIKNALGSESKPDDNNNSNENKEEEKKKEEEEKKKEEEKKREEEKKNEEKKEEEKKTETEIPKTTTTTKKPIAPSGNVCTKAGYARDPDVCSVFYYCLQVGEKLIPLRQQCNPGLVFDAEAVACNWPDLVKC